MERQALLDRIINILSYLKSRVELANSINLTDINIHSENFFRDFLNLLHDYNLTNINIIEQNTAAIDLGDTHKKIAIQVTSTSALAKTKKTVEAFIKKKLYQQYDRLIILNITKKSSHRESHVGDSATYQLDTKNDMWDSNDIICAVSDLPVEKISAVLAFLEKEVKFPTHETLPKEIKTFVSLMELLSDEHQPLAGSGYLEEPDPHGKIEKRFADYAKFLTHEYQDLYIEYGHVLADVTKRIDIGHIRLRRLSLHLKTQSDLVLTKCDGDPKKALESLVQHFAGILSAQSVEYDMSAIRFFLVDQLIKCNVFPNKEIASA